MGRRGPAPKPVELVILEGNPGKRPIKDDRPELPTEAPAMPAIVAGNAHARAEWERIVPLLLDYGLLTRVDMAALAGYCAAWARYVECEAALAEFGLTFDTPQGFVAQRPEVAIGQRALAQVAALCKEFGFTPSARGRMSVAKRPAEEKDPMAALLGGGA